jgi:hypothetical protein
MTGNDRTPAAKGTQSRDTDPWAERILIAHWRSLQPWEKAALVADLSQAVHELSLAGIAARFPEADPEEIELLSARQRLGPDLMRRFPGLLPDR